MQIIILLLIAVGIALNIYQITVLSKHMFQAINQNYKRWGTYRNDSGGETAEAASDDSIPAVKLSYETPKIPPRSLGAEIRPITEGYDLESKDNSPYFRTLRVITEQINPARWRFKIRFLFFNPSPDEIVIDDIHAKVYEDYVPTPILLTISYGGSVELLQDNCIWKEEKAYSLKSGDGFEMVLVLEMSRREGAPAYSESYSRPEQAGPVRSVIGLLVDYYVPGASDIERITIPSDCIYLFECEDQSKWTEMRALDDEAIDALMLRHTGDEKVEGIIQQFRAYYHTHSSLRLQPKV